MQCKECFAALSNKSVYCNSCGTKNAKSRLDNYATAYIDMPGISQKVWANPITYSVCEDFALEAFESKEYYEAIEYFSFSLNNSYFLISEKKQLSFIYNFLGCCYMDLKKFYDAINNFNLAIINNPLNYDVYENRSQVFIKINNPNKAIDDIKILFDNNKMTPRFWYVLGIANENAGKYELAKASYEEAIKLGYIDAQKDLNEINQKSNKNKFFG